MHHGDHRKSYKVVLISLLVFTVITVWVAYHNYGVFNIVVAMGIASIKATLVVLFFMHLKHDNRTNQVVFVSAFVFFAIFIGLTLSDWLFRPAVSALKVTPIQTAGNQSGQMKQFLEATPDLVAHGKEVFLANCQSCHGLSGKGDGPAAAALNPKPRDFTSGYWKQGGTPRQVFKTISEGVSGSPMPGFSALSVKDRWTLVHFVRSLSPNTPSDAPETLGDTTAPQALPEIPVDFVIQRMIKEE